MVFRKMFSFIEKVFQHSSGNLGLIFCDFWRKLIFGRLFILQGLEKMFSFIEKMFSKIYSHFQISAIFGEFEVNFWDF